MLCFFIVFWHDSLSMSYCVQEYVVPITKPECIDYFNFLRTMETTSSLLL